MSNNIFFYVAEKNAFNEEQIAFVMREMFEAVNYIHRQHVMHRDIKVSPRSHPAG